MLNKFQNNQFSSYLIVGAICFVVDFSLFFLIRHYLNFSAVFSSGISFTIAVLCNYCLCFHLVFPKGSYSIIFQILGIFIISGISLIIHITLLKCLILILIPAVFAKLIVIPLITYWNYWARKKLIFYKKK
ncbi:MAG: hypothetical protein K1060chlam5_01159 [Candidatus Anoxychlamydiales bacterium]|nr:hypothetical protein [Candidatus Anoxychlamydiales bacterium]